MKTMENISLSDDWSCTILAWLPEDRLFPYYSSYFRSESENMKNIQNKNIMLPRALAHHEGTYGAPKDAINNMSVSSNME
jgi:hypothetical protein